MELYRAEPIGPVEQRPGQQQHQRLTVATQETAFLYFLFFNICLLL